MIVQVKYFGLLADITKKVEEQFEFQEQHISIEALKTTLENLYKQFEHNNYSIAVNQIIVSKETYIIDKDIVALLPPYAGG
jgi:sulfur-carrier protein